MSRPSGSGARGIGRWTFWIPSDLPHESSTRYASLVSAARDAGSCGMVISTPQSPSATTTLSSSTASGTAGSLRSLGFAIGAGSTGSGFGMRGSTNSLSPE